MRKVTVQMSEDLARALKIRAAEEFTTIAAIVTRAIEKELGKGGETKRK